MVDECLAELGDVGLDVGLHAIDEGCQLGRGSPGRDQLRFEVLDPRRALMQLDDQLGDLVGQRDGLGKLLLLGAHAGELGLERGDVFVPLRELRLDLRSYLADHHRECLLAEHELARMYVSQFPVLANAMAGVVRSAGDVGLTARVPLVVPVVPEAKPTEDSDSVPSGWRTSTSTRISTTCVAGDSASSSSARRTHGACVERKNARALRGHTARHRLVGPDYREHKTHDRVIADRDAHRPAAWSCDVAVTLVELDTNHRRSAPG